MADGNIIYANGRAVFMLERVQSTLILKDGLVGELAATVRTH